MDGIMRNQEEQFFFFFFFGGGVGVGGGGVGGLSVLCSWLICSRIDLSRKRWRMIRQVQNLIRILQG